VSSNFLVNFVYLLFEVLSFAILARVVLSWLDQTGSWRISEIVHEITEPILGPIRNILPTVGMFDFSPIVAILLLNALGRLLLQILQ